RVLFRSASRQRPARDGTGQARPDRRVPLSRASCDRRPRADPVPERTDERSPPRADLGAAAQQRNGRRALPEGAIGLIVATRAFLRGLPSLAGAAHRAPRPRASIDAGVLVRSVRRAERADNPTRALGS